MQSSSLSNWTLRLARICNEVLDASLHAHSELNPTDQLTELVDINPSWTLLSLADLSQRDDSTAVSSLCPMSSEEKENRDMRRRYKHRSGLSPLH